MVVKVNIEDLPALSQRFQIHSIPMTMVFSAEESWEALPKPARAR